MSDESQQQHETEAPTAALAAVYRELADEAAEWGGVITEQELRRKARTVGAEEQPAGPCDGCGHPEHPARECSVTLYGERCACDEPTGAGVQHPAAPCEDCTGGAHGPNYHRAGMPEPPAAAQAYPAIAAYLGECHAEIIKLTAERDLARSVSVTLEQTCARVLELLEQSPEGWLWTSANINAAIAVLRGDDAED